MPPRAEGEGVEPPRPESPPVFETGYRAGGSPSVSGPGRRRTCNPPLKRRELYRLSYGAKMVWPAGSNLRRPAFQAGALPAELRPHWVVRNHYQFSWRARLAQATLRSAAVDRTPERKAKAGEGQVGGLESSQRPLACEDKGSSRLSYSPANRSSGESRHLLFRSSPPPRPTWRARLAQATLRSAAEGRTPEAESEDGRGELGGAGVEPAASSLSEKRSALLSFPPVSSGTRTRTSISTFRAWRPAFRRSRIGAMEARGLARPASPSISLLEEIDAAVENLVRKRERPSSSVTFSLKPNDVFQATRQPFDPGSTTSRCTWVDRRPTWRSFGGRASHSCSEKAQAKAHA